jgi:hypothetical protein
MIKLTQLINELNINNPSVRLNAELMDNTDYLYYYITDNRGNEVIMGFVDSEEDKKTNLLRCFVDSSDVNNQWFKDLTIKRHYKTKDNNIYIPYKDINFKNNENPHNVTIE